MTLLSKKTLFRHGGWAILPLLLVGGLLLVARPTNAGPVTNPSTPPSAPFVKLGVYQGVIGIIADNNYAFEIGNAGTDIASSYDMNLLPSQHAVGAGITIAKSNTQAEDAVYVHTGRICLNSNGAGSYQCVSSWAVSGGGDTLWSQASGNKLQPATTTPVIDLIRVGSDTGLAVTAGHGHPLDIYSSTAVPALYATGTLSATGNVHVAGQVRVTYYPSWSHSVILFNSGLGPWNALDIFADPTTHSPWFQPTGMDADTFDSVATLPFSSDKNLFWKTSTLAGSPNDPGVLLCLKTTNTALCTGGTNPGTPCTVGGTQCLGGGTCQALCVGNDTTCAADETARAIPFTTDPKPNYICSNGMKRYTHFCRGGTAPAYPSSHYCEANSECTTLYGAASTCQIASVSLGCNGTAGYGHACSTDADCVPYGNKGCGRNNCEGQGTPRFNINGSVVLQPGNQADFNGYCYRDDHTCTSNSDCNAYNVNGTVAETGTCYSMGFCSQGSRSNGNQELGSMRFCQGGTRATRDPGVCQGGTQNGRLCEPMHNGVTYPMNAFTQACISGGGTCIARRISCDSVEMCIGGAGDSFYYGSQANGPTSCNTTYSDTGSGQVGAIGNAYDYCPDSGPGNPSVCVPDLYCSSSNDCYNGEACIHGMVEPVYNSSDAFNCDNYCKQLDVNRCSGKTGVFGQNINSCSNYGTNARYTSGVVVGYLSGATSRTMCDCTTTQQTYSVGSSGGDLCTPKFE